MNEKVICAGHVCIDITPVFDDQRTVINISDLLIPGKLINMHGVSVNTGGSVANTGLAMKILGNDVRLMGKIGGDVFGSMIRDIFAGYGAGGLVVEKDARTSYSVVLAIPGMDRIFLHDPGANDSFSETDIPWDDLGGTKLFHFGYPPLMKRMYEDQGESLRFIFQKMKQNNIATSLDLAAIDPQSPAGQADWRQILEKTLPYVDFFLPSFEELCWILDRETWQELADSGKDMTDDLDMVKYAKPLAEQCIERGCGAVLIKCGVSGMYYKTASRERIAQIGKNLEIDREQWENREGIQPCIKAEVVRSATGSGDVAIAAFLTSMLRGKRPEECVRLAAAEGAASVTAYDALSGIKPLEELEKM